jgi:hypothetical protein
MEDQNVAYYKKKAAESLLGKYNEVIERKSYREQLALDSMGMLRGFEDEKAAFDKANMQIDLIIMAMRLLLGIPVGGDAPLSAEIKARADKVASDAAKALLRIMVGESEAKSAEFAKAVSSPKASAIERAIWAFEAEEKRKDAEGYDAVIKSL